MRFEVSPEAHAAGDHTFSPTLAHSLAQLSSDLGSYNCYDFRELFIKAKSNHSNKSSMADFWHRSGTFRDTLLTTKMSTTTLLFGGKAVSVSTILLRQDCHTSTELLSSLSYSVRSEVDPDAFKTFVAGLNGEAIEITPDNFSDLSLLCREFGHRSLLAQLVRVSGSPDFKMKDLQEAILKHENEMNIFREFGRRLDLSESRIEAILCEVSGLRTALSTVTTEMKSRICEIAELNVVENNRIEKTERLLSGPGGIRAELAKTQSDLSELLKEVKRSVSQIGALSAATEQLRVTQLNEIEAKCGKHEMEEMKTELNRLSSSVKTALPKVEESLSTTTKLRCDVSVLKRWTGVIQSVIVSDWPAIFDSFFGKRFDLLWRGSRDGFGVKNFHDRCDGHGPTLTMILDTNGNIFGGYTPLTWESRKWNGRSDETNSCLKCDDSQTSFVFTLKNRHIIGPRRFALKPDRKQFAIYCNAVAGPVFGCYPAEFSIKENCQIEGGCTYAGRLGTTYVNDTGLTAETILTSAWAFTVKEIEVFEIQDSQTC
jgi:hypothetical protein